MMSGVNPSRFSPSQIRDRTGRRQRQIFENPDAGQLTAAALGQKHDIVASLLQMPRQMQVLPGEILMDEQKVHLPKGQRRAEVTFTAARVANGLIRRRGLLVLVLEPGRFFENTDVHRLERVAGGSSAAAGLSVTFRRRDAFRKARALINDVEPAGETRRESYRETSQGPAAAARAA